MTSSQFTRSQTDWSESKETPKPSSARFSFGNIEEGGLDLGQLASTLRRRFLIVTGITALVTAGSLYWSLSQPPVYEAHFQILVEPVTAESQVVSEVKGGGQTTEDPAGIAKSSAQLDYATQIQVLLSPKLLNPVLQKLGDRYPDLTYDTFVKKLSIAQVDRRGATKVLQIVYQGRTLEETKDVINLLAKTYLRYSLTERQTNLGRAVQFMNLQVPKTESQVRKLESELQKFRERYSLVDPSSLASQVSNQLASIQQSLITNQIDLTEQKALYSTIQAQIQSSTKSAEAASVLSEAPEYIKLSSQLKDAETQLAIAEIKLTPDHPDVIALKEVRNKLLPLLKQTAQRSVGTQLANEVETPQSLPYQNAIRRDLSKNFIETAIKIQALEARNRGVTAARDQLNTQIKLVPTLARQYENLQRQLQISTATLQRLLTARESLLINSARQEVPWELLAPPELPSVIPTSLPRDIVLGVLLGLTLGVGVALLVDRANDVIYSERELRQEAGLPVLGIIPAQQDFQGVAFAIEPLNLGQEMPTKLDEQTRRYQFSPFLESFRSLFSQICLLSPDVPIKMLVVSSTVPEEGKTTVAIHLAQAASAMGKKVLLVDTDLRRPRIHSALGINGHLGVANVVGMDFDVKDAIQSWPGEDHLYVLPAGTLPAEPTRILASHKFRQMAESFRSSYDLVIFDAPPMGLADVTLLSSYTDGLLLVTKIGTVCRRSLKDHIRSLHAVEIPILGIVANGVKEDETGYSLYRQYAQRVETEVP